MVYGRLITQPTRFGAVPLSADDSAAKGIDGYVGCKNYSWRSKKI